MIKNMKIISILLMLMALVGKLISLIRDMLIASKYGTSFTADAYNISYTVIVVFFGLINSALYNTLLPFMTNEYEKGKDSLFSFLNKVTTFIILIGGVIITVTLIYSENIISLIAPNLSSRTHVLAIKLVEISIISIIFLLFNSVYSAALRVFNQFVLPSVGAALFSLPSIIYLMFFKDSGIEGLSIATTLGFFLQMFIQVPYLLKMGYKYKLTLKFLDSRLIKMTRLMPPILLSSGLVQINTLVDNIFASKFDEGSITIISIASKVNGIVFTIVGTSILTVIYPLLTKEFNNGNKSKYGEKILETINLIIGIMLPIAVSVMIFKEEIIEFLFLRNQFHEQAVYVTANVLLCYTIGLVFFVLRDLFMFSFYAIKDTITPLRLSAISIIINLILNLIFIKYTNLGLQGIALSTSITAIINFGLLLYNFKIKVFNLNLLFNQDLYKCLIGVTIAGISSLLLKEFLYPLNVGSTLIVILLSITIYIVLLTFLKHSFINIKLLIILIKTRINK